MKEDRPLNKQSQVSIELETHSIFTQNKFAEDEGKIMCLHFPQFREVVYSQIPEGQLSTTLEQYVRKVLQANSSLFIEHIDPNSEKFIIKQFGREEKIAHSALLRWKNRRISIIFEKNLSNLLGKSRTSLVIRLGKHQGRGKQIPLNDFRKMRVRELILFHDMNDSRFTSLSVKGSIIQSFQTLATVDVSQTSLQITPLLTYQAFSSWMHQIYYKLQKKTNMQQLIESLASGNNAWKKYMESRYQGLKSNRIDRTTQLAIIYLTSPFYQAQQDKIFYRKLTNGMIVDPENNKSVQMLCVMFNKIQSLSSPGNFPLIYLIEKLEQEGSRQAFVRGQIRRLQTFSPAFTELDYIANFKRNKPAKDVQIFEIEHLSAEYVGLFNGQIDSYNYIIMPFTEYLVEGVRTANGNLFIKLVEIPIPRRIDTNLVIWIDDKIKEGREFESKHLKDGDIGVQILFFKDNVMYELWLKRYYSLLAGRQFRIVSNMSRKGNPKAGLQTVFLSRRYLRDDVGIMLYVADVEKCMQILTEGECPQIDKLLISKEQATLQLFVKSLCPNVNKEAQQCELVKCNIF